MWTVRERKERREKIKTEQGELNTSEQNQRHMLKSASPKTTLILLCDSRGGITQLIQYAEESYGGVGCGGTQQLIDLELET
jgi:hypothetical protein